VGKLSQNQDGLSAKLINETVLKNIVYNANETGGCG